MRLIYICSQCGEVIDQFSVRSIDESALGFDCLTEEQRRELLCFDQQQNTLTVQSLCDRCIDDLGLETADAPPARQWIQ